MMSQAKSFSQTEREKQRQKQIPTRWATRMCHRTKAINQQFLKNILI